MHNDLDLGDPDPYPLTTGSKIAKSIYNQSYWFFFFF